MLWEGSRDKQVKYCENRTLEEKCWQWQDEFPEISTMKTI